MENNIEVPQKTKNRITIRSSNPTPGIYPDKTIIQKDTCTPEFTVALFTINSIWEQPKCPWTDEWIKMWCIHTQTHTHTDTRTHTQAQAHTDTHTETHSDTHTLDYYSAIKKNEIMPSAAT